MRRRFALLIALSVIGSPLVGPAEAADCAALQSRFERAVAARALKEAQDVSSLIADKSACAGMRAAVMKDRVALDTSLAADSAGPLRTDADREQALTDAVDNDPDSWEAAQRLADFLVKVGRFADAAGRYEDGIARASHYGKLSNEQKAKLLKQAGAAKLLASNDAEGTRAATLQRSSRATDGTVQGIYAPAMRGAVVVAIPVPIQFDFDSADLTQTGQDAALELLKALKQQGIRKITLVGHTDSRGSDDYNMRLSERRLQSVRAFLAEPQHEDFVPGLQMALVAKGKREPFDVSVLPSPPSQDELWALDRRVDWVAGGAHP